MLDLYVKRGIRFSLRDKRLFEITEVEITRVDCIFEAELNNTTLSLASIQILIKRKKSQFKSGEKLTHFLRIGDTGNPMNDVIDQPCVEPWLAKQCPTPCKKHMVTVHK